MVTLNSSETSGFKLKMSLKRTFLAVQASNLVRDAAISHNHPDRGAAIGFWQRRNDAKSTNYIFKRRIPKPKYQIITTSWIMACLNFGVSDLTFFYCLARISSCKKFKSDSQVLIEFTIRVNVLQTWSSLWLQPQELQVMSQNRTPELQVMPQGAAK